MQPDEKMNEWMEKMEAENAGQQKYARLQFIISLVGAACAVLALVLAAWCAVVIMPKAVSALDHVDTVLTQAETELDGLQDITDQLNGALPDMIENTNSLVVDAQGQLQDAAGKLDDIDIEGLNKAISDLQAIVKPLASLFGR